MVASGQQLVTETDILIRDYVLKYEAEMRAPYRRTRSEEEKSVGELCLCRNL